MDELVRGCLDCEKDPISALKRLFVDSVQAGRVSRGQNAAARPVFTKTQGVAHGWFEPLEDLGEFLKIGVFGLRRLSAWVRFSADAAPSDSDHQNNTCGIALKLFAVNGPKLLGQGDTQDFLLQNFDRFFVDTAKEMCELSVADIIGPDEKAFTGKHKLTAQIFKEMADKVESSLLAATYWGVLPYAFGGKKVVKYKLAPRLTNIGIAANGPNYLAADLASRLREAEAIFDFYVQFQKDKNKQPIERATKRWEEKDSPPVRIATLTLPRQDINELGQRTYGENLAFNPWHCLKEHKPLGSIAEARRVAYEASADLRRTASGLALDEPGEPRKPSELPVPAKLAVEEDSTIAFAAIYPPIGIARLGNSVGDFFLGQEVTDPEPEKPGFYRDKKGALKRQAARFRIYGFNAAGAAVAELNASNAKIRWTVHLANKKAAWYQFQMAGDIPEAAAAPLPILRNIDVADRRKLMIDPGPCEIAGEPGKHGKNYAFDSGRFLGKKVYLGELRTDEKGRLLVLGGRGHSASTLGKTAKTATFANNDRWYDDISDGPVTAEVRYGGKKIAVVAPAWVVVAPPNYAPNRKSVRTMWDVMRDKFITAKTLHRPIRPSFELDIRPIFERLSGLQWVNAGFAATFGWQGPYNLADPAMLRRLSKADAIDAELRKTIANQFRRFDRDGTAAQPWPLLWGDAWSEPPNSPRAFSALSDTQLAMLQQWADGDFEADYQPDRIRVRRIEDLPVTEQPDMLTRAAMEFCIADAFHPGAEMTWPMRHASLYSSAFRIKHPMHNSVEPNYGALLTDEIRAVALGAQYPGGITRWLAVPWQTDTATCDSGGYGDYDPYLPSFWPARVPNQVLTAKNYGIVMNEKLPLDERRAAFAQRADWIRPLSTDDPADDMIEHFAELGIVEHQRGPVGDPSFPAVMEVESVPTPSHVLLIERRRRLDARRRAMGLANPATQRRSRRRS